VSLTGEHQAAAAVQFERAGSYIVATVEDPYAAKETLDAAFKANHLDITLTLVPVSPSIVGAVVFMDGTAGGIETVPSATRQGPGGPLPVALRIPAGFRGQAQIVLGRSARAGEKYVSCGDAFAEGECLYRSGLVGLTVQQAVAKLDELGVNAEWRAQVLGEQPVPAPTPVPTTSATSGSTVSASPAPTAAVAPVKKAVGARSDVVTADKILDWYVTGAVPSAEDAVIVFAQEERPAAGDSSN
jgi:hypothetical protein